MNSRKNAIDVDTTLTNHKKNVQPEMNHARNVGKLDILPKCPEVGKTMSTCWMKWAKWNLEDSSEEEERPDGNMRLLHVATLKMNNIKDRQNYCESSEWWEVL